MPSRFRMAVCSRAVVTRIVAVAAVAAAGAAGAAVVVPALASSTHGPVVRPADGGMVLIAPTAAQGRLSPAATGKAVSTCAFYAAKAGWPNNGYFGGDLVTAATICVAESRGDPHRKVCNGKTPGSITGEGDWPKFQCPAGSVSYDRGLWQLNSKTAHTSDKCAFDPVCNAGQAYLDSGRGISFAPWSSYDQQTYQVYLDLVQAAVTKLAHGTVTNALLGECLAQSKPVAGAPVVSRTVDVVNCGSGAADQQWFTSGGKLRSGSQCAAIGSSGRSPGVVLRRCARTKTQDWAVSGRYELRNAADHKCLTDPSLTAGTQVDVTTCANAKNQTWWLP